MQTRGISKLVSLLIRAFLAVLFCLPATTIRSASSIVPDAGREYLVEVWRTDDGLPQNSITSIVQTPDGYLWLGTFNGLVRFNGVDFKVFDAFNAPQLGSGRVTRLCLDKEGGLWVMSEEGALATISPGRFLAVEEGWGMPPGRRGLVGVDPGGSVWVEAGEERTLYRGAGGTFHPGSPPHRITERALPLLRAGLPGCLWAADGSNWVIAVQADLAEFLNCPDGTKAMGGAAFPSRAGGVWYSTPCGLRELRGGQWTRTIALSDPNLGASNLMEDREGNLWLGTWGKGLFRLGADGNQRSFNLSGATGYESVRAIYEDAEGSIWVGLDGGGLCRLRKRGIQSFGPGEGLRGHLVRSVIEQGPGEYWIFAQGKVDRLRLGQPPTAEPLELDLQARTPWCAIVDRQRNIWAGTLDGGVFRYRDGGITSVPVREGHLGQYCTVLFEERSGGLWLGTDHGLWKHAGEVFEPVPSEIGVKGEDVRAIAEGPGGELYVGINGGGLLARRGNEWRRYRQKDGLPSDRIWSLYADAEGAVWIGTRGHGLSRFAQGKFFNYPAAEAGLPRAAGSIIEDDSGHLWLGSEKGLTRVKREELVQFAGGKRSSITTTAFGHGDGMGSSECTSGSQPLAWKASDGRLWFATVKGVSVVDPKNLPLNSLPSPVAIERLVADTQVYGGDANSLAGSWKSEPGATGEITLPAGTQRLEFHYAALTYIAPGKARYKYRLDGVDTDWVAADDRRLATYTKMSPGRYRFQVTAANNDGVWNPTGAWLSVVVLPHYWQTGWFRATGWLLLAALLFAAYDARVRRLKQAQAMQEAFSRKLIDAQEQERKRLASELHDSLGQNLLVIKNRAAFALAGVTGSPAPPEALAEISQMASETLEEVRELSRNLRPYQLDRLQITKALQALGQRIATSLPLDLRVELDPIDDLFTPEQQVSLYRIVQEALNNVVKHSGARAAQVTISRGPAQVKLCVEDDGRGFDAHALASQGSQGLGLTSITERVRFLGGTLAWHSAPGQGTRLEIDLPAPPRPATS